MYSNILLLSIRRQHVELIIQGVKHFELRRVRPGVCEGDLVLVYVPLPIASVVGCFQVGSVVAGTPGQVWSRIGLRSGLSQPEYDNYFDGSSAAYAIKVVKPSWFTQRVDLERIRRHIPSFSPPQSYHYLRQNRLCDVRLVDLCAQVAGGGCDELSSGDKC